MPTKNGDVQDGHVHNARYVNHWPLIVAKGEGGCLSRLWRFRLGERVYLPQTHTVAACKAE